MNILRKSIKAKKPVQMAFLDLENAFGSAKHNLILAVLSWYNVPKCMISFIKSLYDNCHVTVTTSQWTTKPIQIQKGSLQGGPEAGILFNVPWNIIISGLATFLKKLGYTKLDKPLSAFADDANIKTHLTEHLQINLNYATFLSSWSKFLHFKESKSFSLAFNDNGKAYDPQITLNGKPIPSTMTKPHKLLGKWFYSPLEDKDNIKATSKKLSDLILKLDKVPLDGRKKDGFTSRESFKSSPGIS